ncbi:MAG: hypothetical protein ACRYFU_00290 [Janthinobacterium lividum]
MPTLACRLAIVLPNWLAPANASRHGSTLDTYLSLNLWIALALLALLHLLLFAGLLLRRRTETHSFRLVEVVPMLGFALLLTFLAFRSERLWADSRYIGPDPAALQVEVTGMQFAWYFRYPGQDYAFGRSAPQFIDPSAGNPIGIDPSDSRGQDDFISSELVLPAGREVDLHLRAQDVIHGFAIPSMRLKQNAVPGELIHLHFTPAVPGSYAILCTQLCGLGHYRMNSTLLVLSNKEFDTWLATHSQPKTGINQ